jgi:hypothetical protein
LSQSGGRAASFDPLFDLPSPRTDAPLALPIGEIEAESTSIAPFTAHQSELLGLAERLPVAPSDVPRGGDRIASAVLLTARFLDV